MKICTVEHTVPAFGTIPVGSLWADDSPYVLDENADCFDDADKPAPKPKKRVV